jgi:hypothetical protein
VIASAIVLPFLLGFYCLFGATIWAIVKGVDRLFAWAIVTAFG